MLASRFIAAFRESFGSKLILGFIGIIATLQIVSSVIIINREIVSATEEIINTGKTLSESIAHSSKNGIFAENKDILRAVAEGSLQHREVGAVFIHDYDLQDLVTLRKKSFNSYSDAFNGDRATAIKQRLTSSKDFEVIQTSLAFEIIKPVIIEMVPDNEEAFYFNPLAPSVKKEKVIGFVALVLDKQNLKQRIMSVAASNGLTALMVIISGMVMIFMMVKRITIPLTTLSGEVRKVGKGEQITKVNVGTKDEIGKLAESFNIMLEDLQKKEEQTRSLEEKLYHSRKMEALGTLARGIAHDFNNILGTLEGGVYMFQKKLVHDKVLLRNSERLHRSIERARTLINSLLTFSNGQSASLYPIDINKFIDDTSSLFLAKFDEHINFTFSLCGQALYVMANPVQLDQVLTNIISNACDTISSDGSVAIITNRAHKPRGMEAGQEPELIPRECAVITISDTGCGIDKAIQDRIFEPFFTTKEVGKGTGLGLSIAYGIVSEYGGYISVESELGRGTSFSIYLPLCDRNTQQSDLQEGSSE